MLNTIKKLTIENYSNNTVKLTKIMTIKNVLFLKQRINKTVDEIVIDCENYEYIKQILFQLVNNDNDVVIAFKDLESVGLNAFVGYGELNGNVKTLLNNKYKFLLDREYECYTNKLKSPRIKSPVGLVNS